MDCKNENNMAQIVGSGTENKRPIPVRKENIPSSFSSLKGSNYSVFLKLLVRLLLTFLLRVAATFSSSLQF